MKKVYIIIVRWNEGSAEIVGVFEDLALALSRLRALQNAVPWSDPYTLETHEVIHG